MKKAVISILLVLAGTMAGAGAVEKAKSDRLKKAWAMSDKHFALFQIMNQWVKVKQEGKNLAEYFKREGFKNIAIYGMSYVGQTLADELRDTGICVAYGIDKNADSIHVGIDVISMEDNFKKIDVVVVTAITFFDEIEEELSRKVECPVISLEDILYGV